jgi:GT2 family glycosyltransferase
VLRSLWRQKRGRATAGSEQRRADESKYPDVLGALRRMKGSAQPPAVVVPIHKASAALRRCLAALVAFTPDPCRIILIDDASADAAVEEELARIANESRVERYGNMENLGFTRTANRGFALAAGHDVVLLNADAEVGPRWLMNLRLAAYSAERVATATPFADNAGAFSAPAFNAANVLPAGISMVDAARLLLRDSVRAYPEIPTGGGFCMYVRRDCLAEIGGFDADAFPRGYGEENDFCMRARAVGWTHVLDDATYVRHERAASFGAEKTALLKQGLAVLRSRYPDYLTLVEAFGKDPALVAARSRVAASLAKSHRRVMARRLVLAGDSPITDPGGSDHEVFGARTIGERLHLSRVGTGSPSLPPELSANSGEGTQAVKAALAAWLVRLGIESLVIDAGARHAGMAAALADALGIPVDAA